MKRKAIASWYGTGKDGTGHLSTQSAILNETQFSFKSRFAEGIGTNPEELLAASHASCFSMKLSFVIQEAGFTPEKIQTTSEVTLENNSITRSRLIVNAKIPEITKEVFENSVRDAKENCPISKVLNALITVETSLSN